MAVTQSTILASATTEGTSDDVTVDAGAIVSVGIFGAAGACLPGGVRFIVYRDTPSADNIVAHLDGTKRDTLLSGPGTYRVYRPALSGDAFGVFKDV